MKIIDRILAIADDKNIRQADIAKKLGKGTSLITNWKNRGTTPPAELLPDIAHILGVSVEYLITGTERIIPGTVLPDEEQQLLDYYNASNQDGKSRIMEQAEFIAAKYPAQGKSSEYKIG